MEKIKNFLGNKLYLGLTIGGVVLLVAAILLVILLPGKANGPAGDLTGCTIEVGKEMSANPRRIARIETVISVPLPADNPHKEALSQCVLGSPAMLSLHPDIEVPITWNWLG